MLSNAELTYYSGIYADQADAQSLTGQQKTDFIAGAIDALEFSETQQYFNLQAKFGVGGSYVAEFGNGGNYVKATHTGAFLYDPSGGPSGTDVATASFDPATYDPNFTYLLTDNPDPNAPGEKQTLSDGIKVWTEDELINAIGAGLLKTVTSTEINTVTNITAQKITLNASGNIGTIDNPVTDLVGFSTAVKPVVVDPQTQLALGAAERADLNFLTVAPISATVNFTVDGNGVGAMTRTDGGTWSTNVFHVGNSVYIGGNSGNATEGGVYQVIDAISADGKTIYFLPSSAISSGVTTNSKTLAQGDVVRVSSGYDTSRGVIGDLYVYNGPSGADVDLAQANYKDQGIWTDIGPAPGPSAGPTIRAEFGRQILAAPVVINLDTVDNSTHTTPVATQVSFGNINNNGTITLASGTWDTNAYKAGEGIFIASHGTTADPNANAPGGYYTIASVSGAVITLKWGQVLTPEGDATHPVTVDLAPETISIASGASNVNFVLISTSKDIGIAATAAVNATAGGFIFLGSQGGVEVDQIKAGTGGVNPTGADVRLKAQGPITDVASVQAAENVTLANATVTFANLNNSGTITRVDGGTWSGYAVGQGIVIGSAGTADPNANAPGAYYTIVAIDSTDTVITLKGGQLLTPEGNVVVKVAAFAPPVNIEGASLVIEAGQAAIGTSAAPINVEILGTGHGFTGRAQNDIFVNAVGDLPVDGIYSSSAGVHLTATGSIYDLVASTFAKIQADSLELQVYGANSTIGQGTDLQHPLHINIVGGGALQAIAPGSIAIDESEGSLNVLNVLSKSGDVALGAAGFLLNGGNVVDPTKLDFGLAAGNAGANVRGNSIVLNPDPTTDPFWVTTKGGVGTATTSFNIISGFNGGNGTLSATAGNQNVYIVQTVGNVSLMSISPGATAVAFITALAGDILNGRPDENAIVKAGMADLIASGSVGSGTPRGLLTGRIVSTVGNIEAIATNGDIWLWNKGGLKAGGVTASPFAMYAPHGSVNIQTSSPLEIADDIFASGPIVKNAGTSAAIGRQFDRRSRRNHHLDRLLDRARCRQIISRSAAPSDQKRPPA